VPTKRPGAVKKPNVIWPLERTTFSPKIERSSSSSAADTNLKSSKLGVVEKGRHDAQHNDTQHNGLICDTQRK
jgi:hypothetical protein